MMLLPFLLGEAQGAAWVCTMSRDQAALVLGHPRVSK